MPLSSHIKPEPNPPLTLPRVIRAREMYAEGFTVARILAHCEMSLGTLYACLDGNPFADQGEPMPPVPRRRQVLKKRHRALKTDSVSLTNRLLRTAERQVREIETRLSAREQPPVERERDVAHADESDARAARPAGAAEEPKAAEPAEPVEEDDGDPDRLPASIDALRRELSHKLAGMVASEEARKARED